MPTILMAIMLMISILILGCTNQPPPIPTVMSSPMVMPLSPTPAPSPTMTMLYEKHMVMESLTLFNTTNNNFTRFIQNNASIYNLVDENPYYVAFIASKQIEFALPLYRDAIANWTPPDNRFYDKLMEIKKAELYRIEHFSKLIKMMVLTLPTQNDEVIKAVHNKFSEWKNDERNAKPINLQNDILKELQIHPDNVNFIYIIPEKPIPQIPPLFTDKTKGDNF